MKLVYLTSLFLLFLAPASAITHRAERTTIVPSGETIEDSLFVTGDTARIDGTVDGDLIAFTRVLRIRGQVNGNVLTGAREVEIEGTVNGSVVSFSQQFRLGGVVMQNVYAFNQNSRALPAARVDGDMSVFSAEADLEGNIGRGLRVFAGSALIGASVDRDATFRGNSLRVSESSRINGNLIARVEDPKRVTINSNARIAGQVRRDIAAQAGPGWAGLLLFRVFWFLAAYVTGLVFLIVTPRFAIQAAGNMSHGWRSGILGLAVLVAAPLLLALIAITVVGIPLAAMGLAVWLAAVYLAKIVVALAIGRRILPSHSRALALLVGLAIIAVVYSIPFGLGLLAWLVVTCLGLGSLVWDVRLSSLKRSVMTPVQQPLPSGA